jgi:hypothetical protein
MTRRARMGMERDLKSLFLAPFIVAVLALASACGGSGKSSNAAASAPSPSATKPAHDLRITSELEKYVTDEWNKNFSDPAGANYARGVTVTKVLCVPEAETTRSRCTVTPSKGEPKPWWYIVAEDGGSTERAEGSG